jgi:hypothetical protein
MKITAPGTLKDFDGSRRPGVQMHVKATKAPKRRFNVGDKFRYDGGIFEIIYMYRVDQEQGLWFHCIEEQRGELGLLGAACLVAGAGKTTPRVVYEAFRSHNDASTYFSDIYRMGDSSIKNTQELLKLQRVE